MVTRLVEILNKGNEFLINSEFRKDMRFAIRRHLKKKNSELDLPHTPKIAVGHSIDEETLKELNQTMTPLDKKTFLKGILHYENTDFNIYFLIMKSSKEVINTVVGVIKNTVLNNSGHIASVYEFYEIANVYVYTVAQMKGEIGYDDVLNQIKKSILRYNPRLLISLAKRLLIDPTISVTKAKEFLMNTTITNPIETLENQKLEMSQEDLTDVDIVLDSLNLKTDDQLEANKDEFLKQVEDKTGVNLKKKLKILGIGLLIQIAFVSLGLPFGSAASKIFAKFANNNE